MLIRDVMTTNTVTIPSDTTLADARKIMDTHRIRRIPVVDKLKLVGLVTKDALDRTGPSKLTTFSIHELTYLLNKISVKEVMVKDLVTISPDATVEEGVTLAQSKKAGSLLIVEDDRLIGIATTNDFFYKILNPILGIGHPGTRIAVHNCGKVADVAKVLDIVNKQGIELTSMFITPHPETGVQSLTMHLNTEDSSKILDEIKKMGCEVEEIAR